MRPSPPASIRRTLPALLALAALSGSVIAAGTAGAVSGPGTGSAPARRFIPGAESGGRPTDELIVTYGGRLPARMARISLHRVAGTRLVRGVGSFGMDVVRLGVGTSASDALGAYRRSPIVRDVEVSVRRELLLTPNDPDFSALWGLHNTGQSHPLSSGGTGSGTADADVNAPQAWDTGTGSSSTVIAVIDTGTYLTHDDLENRLWMNDDPAGGGDDDGNGYANDTHGYDFGDLDPDPNQSNATCSTTCPAHGTHVAGTALAQFDNGIGVAGVCPDCRLMTLKVTEGSTATFTSTSRLIMAYAYAANNGADVVNGSYGGPVWSNAERKAIKAAGIPFVFAAGNSSLDNDVSACRGNLGCSPSYPASYSLNNIISVASSNDDDGYSGFSNWGRDSVDVAAPGSDIRSTFPLDGYATIGGTSMASPHVAGTVALLRDQFPARTDREIMNMLLNGADQPSGLDLDPALGFLTDGSFTATQGRLDANDALAGSTTWGAPPTDGTPGTAKPLKRMKSGSLSFPEDQNDYFKKKLQKGVKYKVTLTVPNGRQFDLYLWQPGITETWPWAFGCFQGGSGSCPLRRLSASSTAGKDEALIFKPTKGGTHFIHVSSFFDPGNYTVKIVKV